MTPLKSVAVGAASGATTYAASFHALAYTNAFAMPPGFPLALWMALTVFGLGAALVALLVQLVALRASNAHVFPAMGGFVAAALVILVAGGHLQHGYKALSAWVLGAALASAIHLWLRHSSASGASVGANGR